MQRSTDTVESSGDGRQAASPNDSVSVCTLTSLCVGYRGAPILPPISVALGRAQMWAILGRNGSGKSTLLRTVLGLQPAVSGAVVLHRGVRVGYVPQRMTQLHDVPARVVDIVRDGAEVGWSFLRPLRGGVAGCISDALQAARCSELRDAQFHELSEGQKQRVLVARALASHPAMLVLDEPSSAMDRIAERELHEALRSLVDERGLCVLLVNHHVDLTVHYADHALFLDRESETVLSGTTAEVISSSTFRHRYALPAHDESCVDC